MWEVAYSKPRGLRLFGFHYIGMASTSGFTLLLLQHIFVCMIRLHRLRYGTYLWTMVPLAQAPGPALCQLSLYSTFKLAVH